MSGMKFTSCLTSFVAPVNDSKDRKDTHAPMLRVENEPIFLSVKKPYERSVLLAFDVLTDI